MDDALGRLRACLTTTWGSPSLICTGALRQGLPEVVFCQGKTNEHAAAIFERLGPVHDRVLGTRATPDMAAFIRPGCLKPVMTRSLGW